MIQDMATGIDRLGRRAQAMRAQPIDRNWPIPTHTFCHSAIFHPKTPCNEIVWFSVWVSRHMSISLAKKKWKHFRADLKKFQEMCGTWMNENSNWSQKRLGFLPKSPRKDFLKFFLQVSPIPIRKNSYKASVHRAFSLLKRKTTFFWLFFRLSAHFWPHSSAIFYPNTPHNFFFAQYHHMWNDDLSKKNHHIFGKSI